jgi:hypothetical protein
MKSLCYAAVAALAAGLANASPRPQLDLVAAFATGKIGELLGSAKGSEFASRLMYLADHFIAQSLTNLAKMMGASKTSAGSLGSFVSDFMNCIFPRLWCKVEC